MKAIFTLIFCLSSLLLSCIQGRNLGGKDAKDKSKSPRFGKPTRRSKPASLLEKAPEWKSIPKSGKRFFLLGDSVFDNCHWLEGHSIKKDTTSQLQGLAPTYKIVNLAIDSSESKHFLKSGPLFRPNSDKSSRHDNKIRCGYHVTGNNPKKLARTKYTTRSRLKEIIANAKAYDLGNKENYFAISLAGNDFANALTNFLHKLAIRMKSDTDAVYSEQDLEKELQKTRKRLAENLRTILTNLTSINKQIILVGVYLPGREIKDSYGFGDPRRITHEKFDRQYFVSTKTLSELYNNWYSDLIKIAQKFNLPLIDLANTFNPNEINLYQESNGLIEPSEWGSEIIAGLLNWTMNNFEESKDKIIHLPPARLSEEPNKRAPTTTPQASRVNIDIHSILETPTSENYDDHWDQVEAVYADSEE